MGYLLGIDVGTSSAKAVIFDHTGREVREEGISYAFSEPRPGWMEIDPDLWWQSVIAIVDRLMQCPEVRNTGIDAVGICGVMMMAVMLDEAGKPVRPTISWLDQRVLPQFARLRSDGTSELMFQHTGTALSPSQTPLPLLWVKENEPESFERIRKVLFVKDYVRMRLTGTVATDPSDASGSLLYDHRIGGWDGEVCERLGIPTALLPEVIGTSEIAGHVTGSAASLTGLKKGTPVITGSGDGVCTMLGLGITSPGQLGVTVGTAGVLMSPTSRFLLDAKRRCLVMNHAVPGLKMLATATNTAGAALEWYKGTLSRFDYNELNEQAARVAPGCGGLLFHPYLSGSRSPYYNPDARASFVGAGYDHKAEHFTRAVMEGIALELKDCLLAHEEVMSQPGSGEDHTITEIRLSGGIVRSEVWSQILADVLGHPIGIPSVHELGTLGSAINAAVGSGVYESHSRAAAEMVHLVKTIAPNQASAAAYERLFAIYQRMYQQLRPLYSDLAALRRDS